MNIEQLPQRGKNNLWFHYSDSDAVLVFVHGVLSDSGSCWLYKDKAAPANNCYWPDLIVSDRRFNDISIYLAGYYTAVDSGPYEIRNCADEVFAALKRQGPDGQPPVMAKKKIVFVCHSMGGIVTRYLLEANHGEFRDKTVGLVLIASPSYGSRLANSLGNIVTYFNQNQGIQLQWGHWTLDDLDSRFKQLKETRRIPNLCGIELYENHFIVHSRWIPLWTRTLVVNKESAGRYFGAPKQLPNTDHFSACKPHDKTDLVHQYLLDFLSENGLNNPVHNADELIQRYATPSAAKLLANPVSRKGYRVIGFDLDGTLLRGIEFSWTVVWKHLGFPEAVYKAEMRNYRKGLITYKEWCDKTCEQFRSRNLRRSDFQEIVRGINVTQKLRETLTTLRSSGFVLALISGGIDTFIEEKIPDAAELFDYICINRIRYDQPSGLISGCDPTPFDFEGKTAALEAICKRHGCSLKEGVFVGEGFNDEDVIRRVGLSIAYPPGEQAIDAAAKGIEDDDLSKILEHVL
jgi:phosphoserine phosphatase/pimeloyl-ACP methyl ester carboxylesterase